jgi:hypothetical protein
MFQFSSYDFFAWVTIPILSPVVKYITRFYFRRPLHQILLARPPNQGEWDGWDTVQEDVISSAGWILSIMGIPHSTDTQFTNLCYNKQLRFIRSFFCEGREIHTQMWGDTDIPTHVHLPPSQSVYMPSLIIQNQMFS